MTGRNKDMGLGLKRESSLRKGVGFAFLGESFRSGGQQFSTPGGRLDRELLGVPRRLPALRKLSHTLSWSKRMSR